MMENNNQTPNNTLTEERCNSLLATFLSDDREPERYEYDSLTIQEMCFLINSSAIDTTELKAILADKIRRSDSLFLLMDERLNFPFIDAENHCEIFSNLEYAKEAVLFFGEENRKLRIVRMTQVEGVFEQLYRDGFYNVILDNGHYHVYMPVSAIVDLEKIEASPNPVINKELRFNIQALLQELIWEYNYETKADEVRNKEDMMIETLLKSKLYVPILADERFKQNGTVTIEVSAAENFEIQTISNKESGEKFLPTFTNMAELKGIYPSNEIAGLLIPLKTVADIAAKSTVGVALDIGSINYIMRNENLAAIMKEDK